MTSRRFLFDSLESKVPGSSRKVHIRRLADVLQICVHRHDWPRARRAWSILVRCKEFEWKNMWKTGLLLAGSLDSTVDIAGAEGHPQRLEYMRVMMLQSPENRPSILREMILYLIVSDRHSLALDELELYLPSFPYQDDPVLHIYAGMLRLHLVRESGENRDDDSPNSSEHFVNHGSIPECKSHFQRALDLDPGNPIASGFLSRLTITSQDINVEEDFNSVEINLHGSAVDMRPQKRSKG